MRFPYLAYKLAQPHPVTGLSYVARPILPVVLGYFGTEFSSTNYLALLDTGADWCLFDEEVGRILGVPIREGVPRRFFGVERVESTAWFHEVELSVSGIRTKTKAAFVEGSRCPYGILGQAGFFDRFRVSFSGSHPDPFVEVELIS